MLRLDLVRDEHRGNGEGMRALEFGLTGFYPAFEGAPRAKRWEDMGFDIAGFSENHSMVQDCFSEMREAARITERIRLSSGPVNFVTRDPGVVASAILPIQEVSGGRAICGVASGDSAVSAAGKRPQRIKDFERDLGYLRTYLHGRSVQFPERTTKLEWAKSLACPPPPIQVSCSGPKAIAIAGRLADRICLGIGTNKEWVQQHVDIIQRELDEHGRSREDIRIGMFAPLAITADRTSGRATIRTRVSAWAHMQSWPGNDLSKQPPILRKVTAALRNNYDYTFHRPDAPTDRPNPNNAAIDEEFGDWMGIGGPPSYVIDRMSELVEDVGIDFFITHLPPPELEVYAGEVLPVLRKLRQ